VKSSDVPESGTVAAIETELLDTVRVPDCGPPLVGANSTAAVQLAPGPSVEPHVLFTSTNPAETVSERLFKLWLIPVFVTVRAVSVLTEPKPVVGKTIAPGDTAMAAPAAPVPISNRVAGVVTDVEVKVNTPVVAPLAVGAKITAAVQLAPAARLAPQVVCDTLKEGSTVWPDTANVNPLAA
jgi:hypothetical protein